MDNGVPPIDDGSARPDAAAGSNGSASSNGRTGAPKTSSSGNGRATDRRKNGTSDRRKSSGAKAAPERRASNRRTTTASAGAPKSAPVAVIEEVEEPTASTETEAPATDVAAPPPPPEIVIPDVVTVDTAPEADDRAPMFDVPDAPKDDHPGSNGTALLPPMPLPEIVPAEPVTDEPPSTDTAVVPALTPPLEFPAEFRDMDGTDGLPSLLKPKKAPRALKPPVVRQHRRPRVRKVTRVVRHVDTWSVFKVAFVFSAFAYGVLLTAGVLLWQVAQNTGTVDNVERFFESFGWETFELKGGEIYHNAWIAGLFLMVGLTGFVVLTATLFNLITDLVGGIRVTVLEEEVVAREDRGIGWRRARRGVPLVEKLAPPVPPPPDTAVVPAVVPVESPKPVE